MWNVKDLRQPPVSSDPYSRKFLNKEKLRSVHSQLFDCHEICDKQSELVIEREILTKLYYKFKNQWRREKCLRNIKQIQGCLKRWCDLKMNVSLRQLLGLVPSSLRKSKNDPDIRLPSACMVEFVMLRLLGASKLLQKTAEICTTAFQNVTAQLSVGLFVQNMTIVAAAVSRVWILVRFTQKELCKCYSVLHSWLPDLKLPAVSMISKEDPLPTDIYSWLEPESYGSNRMCSLGLSGNSLESSVRSCDSVNDSTLLEFSTYDGNGCSGKEEQEAMLDDAHQNTSDDIGLVLDRTAFEKQTVLSGTMASGVSIQTDSSTVPVKRTFTDYSDFISPAFKSPDFTSSANTSSALKKMKKFLKSVDRLSSGEESADSTPPKKRKFVRLSVAEYRDWSLEVLSCTSIVNIRGFLTKLNHAYPQVDFRGMTKCLEQLKSIEPSRRKMGKKDVDARRKGNKKIMREAKKLVKSMLKRNYTKSLKARDAKRTNIE